MHNSLYFNNPDHANLIILFGNDKLYVKTDIISQSLAYFTSIDTIKQINGSNTINAQQIFHNEEILLDLIERAHFGNKHGLNVNVENWMEYILLCDILLADDSYLKYILLFLRKFDIDKLDTSFYEYSKTVIIPESLMLKITILSINNVEPMCISHDRTLHCAICSRHYSIKNMCNRCKHCNDCEKQYPTVFKQNIIPFLIWLHNSDITLRKVKEFVSKEIDAKYKDNYPQYSNHFSFILEACGSGN